jgi:hypothetical protein
VPYYVYAIHTDQTNNRLYKKFDDFIEADRFEREMSDHCFPHDNYFVRLINAKSDEEAELKADALRP